MSDDIVREVRELVDASVCTSPPIHKYSKFDRTLVVPLVEEAERLRAELEEFRRLMVPVSEDPYITEKTSVTEVRLRQLVEGFRREGENLRRAVERMRQDISRFRREVEDLKV
jgi:hypothetical protein